MARSKRRLPARSQSGDTVASTPSGSGSFLGQVGLFETANGLPHGPGMVLLVLAVALVVYPIKRLTQFLTRR